MMGPPRCRICRLAHLLEEHRPTPTSIGSPPAWSEARSGSAPFTTIAPTPAGDCINSADHFHAGYRPGGQAPAVRPADTVLLIVVARPRSKYTTGRAGLITRTRAQWFTGSGRCDPGPGAGATLWRWLAGGGVSADGRRGQDDRCGSAHHGGGEHHDRVLERLQGVPLRRDDQQVAFVTLPAGAAGAQQHVSTEHDDRRLAWAVVLGQ
jgi:hypothetical protein